MCDRGGSHISERPLDNDDSGMWTTLSRESRRPVDEVVSISGDNATMLDGRLLELLLIRPLLTIVLVDADNVEPEIPTDPSDIGGEILID